MSQGRRDTFAGLDVDNNEFDDPDAYNSWKCGAEIYWMEDSWGGWPEAEEWRNQ